jgi:hypothetical protein
VVAAGMAKTAIGIRWMQLLAFPAVPLFQLRLDPKIGFPETRSGAPGPWGPWLDRPRDPRPVRLEVGAPSRRCPE